jgi:hypothetical protein
MEDGKETEVINRIKEDEDEKMYSIFFSLSFYSTHLQGNVPQLEKALVGTCLHLPSL